MGLYQRSNGVFYLQKRINGRLFRRSLETRNRSEAEMLYDQWRREYLLSKISGQQKIPLPLNVQAKTDKRRAEEFHRPNFLRAYAEYMKECENEDNTNGTLSSKKKVLQILHKEQFSWEDLNPENMTAFQTTLKKDYSHSTAGKLIKFFKAFLNFAIKRDYFNYHDYKRISFIREPAVRQRKYIFSEEDIRACLEYCAETSDIDFYYYLLILYLTGSRPSEITPLKIKDIDLQKNTIFIWMNKVQRFKTAFMDAEILRGLCQLAQAQDMPEGYIFAGSMKNKEFYASKFRAMKLAIGLHEDSQLRLLRHTAGSKAYEKTGDIFTAKELLGHQHIRETLKSYVDPAPRHLKKVSKKLAKGLKRR